MKKLLAILALSLATTAQADFFGGNNSFGGNNGEWKMGPYGYYYEENDWPEWTPMYWMEEFMNEFDDNNDNGYGSGFNMPFFGNGSNNYGMPYGGYGSGNNNYGMPYGGYGGGYSSPATPYNGYNYGYPTFPYGSGY